MTLDNLLLAVPIDDRVQTLERAAPHHVAHCALLDAKTLYLIVDVEEERVITRGVITGTHQETA